MRLTLTELWELYQRGFDLANLVTNLAKLSLGLPGHSTWPNLALSLTNLGQAWHYNQTGHHHPTPPTTKLSKGWNLEFLPSDCSEFQHYNQTGQTPIWPDFTISSLDVQKRSLVQFFRPILPLRDAFKKIAEKETLVHSHLTPSLPSLNGTRGMGT